MRELALFAGAGGGILGGLLLGWRTVGAVEIDAYCRSVLLARQRDGFLPRFPIWDDVRTFDGYPWRGRIDVISGGFPCQDISSAGAGAGLSGDRSGLWFEFERIIEEVEPTYVFIENSPYLRTRGLVTVLQGLARLGFDAEWGVFSAKEVGAPHERKRMWIVAHADRSGQRGVAEHGQVARASEASGPVCEPPRSALHVAHPDGTALWEQSRWRCGADWEGSTIARGNDWWPVDLISGVDDGVANRLVRVRATGNGQVPRVAALAWSTLRRGL